MKLLLFHRHSNKTLTLLNSIYNAYLIMCVRTSDDFMLFLRNRKMLILRGSVIIISVTIRWSYTNMLIIFWAYFD